MRDFPLDTPAMGALASPPQRRRMCRILAERLDVVAIIAPPPDAGLPPPRCRACSPWSARARVLWVEQPARLRLGALLALQAGILLVPIRIAGIADDHEEGDAVVLPGAEAVDGMATILVVQHPVELLWGAG